MSTTINPNEPLSVTLQARQWNLVLQTMNEGMGAIASLLADIQNQCMSQQRFMGSRPNGEDTELTSVVRDERRQAS